METRHIFCLVLGSQLALGLPPKDLHVLFKVTTLDMKNSFNSQEHTRVHISMFSSNKNYSATIIQKGWSEIINLHIKLSIVRTNQTQLQATQSSTNTTIYMHPYSLQSAFKVLPLACEARSLSLLVYLIFRFILTQLGVRFSRSWPEKPTGPTWDWVRSVSIQILLDRMLLV